jgi:hypothetical protein
MQRLRSAHSLARLVLAWFGLVLGLAAAAPLVQPTGLQVVCSPAGVKLVAPSDGGEGPASVSGLDCPLCMVVAPPPVRTAATPPHPGVAAPQAIRAGRVAARPAAPLPARGPPAFA